MLHTFLLAWAVEKKLRLEFYLDVTFSSFYPWPSLVRIRPNHWHLHTIEYNYHLKIRSFTLAFRWLFWFVIIMCNMGCTEVSRVTSLQIISLIRNCKNVFLISKGVHSCEFGFGCFGTARHGPALSGQESSVPVWLGLLRSEPASIRHVEEHPSVHAAGKCSRLVARTSGLSSRKTKKPLIAARVGMQYLILRLNKNNLDVSGTSETNHSTTCMSW